jgi:predicted dehydrogenase
VKIKTEQNAGSASKSVTDSTDDEARGSHKVRYAVVGLGHIAQAAVLPGFAGAKNSELVALVSGDEKKLRALKKKYAVPQTYSYERFDDCLADPEIDAVYIALPNDMHMEYAVRAARAHKHILCEKPLALTVEEARIIGREANDHGVKLMTAYRLHFEPATLATIELVKSGKLGEPRYFNSSFSYPLTDNDNIRLQYDRGGGPVYDIGIYCINAARYLMRDEPIEVSAMLARSPDERFDQVEESAAVLLRFPEGRLASFVVSFGAATASRLEFAGTKGSVVLDPGYEYSEGLRQVVTIDDKPEEKTFPQTNQFGGEIEAFSQCILEDRTPEASAEEAIADLRIIEAIFASASQQRPVRLSPFQKSSRPNADQRKEKRAVKNPQTVRADSPHD